MSTPVMVLNISAVRCGWLPLPAELYESSPGWARASAISSFTLRTGSEGCATSRLGSATRFVIAVKSRIGSKGSFG